ncbi:TPA: hypothetical protein ACKRDR_000356 [Proteus mirabilis]|nr:hypothetical protein [Proteus mirabilis]HEJ0061781.1 hypothetical protein [Proteus mirabilis]HEJ9539988.1 hypothetical protein [Proteus mirabilis]HEK2049132.1 hypothetical protein [Proteus mirabilis]HEK2074074.1 hypothetical protein [Proteus mirabilis]
MNIADIWATGVLITFIALTLYSRKVKDKAKKVPLLINILLSGFWPATLVISALVCLNSLYEWAIGYTD